jgi:hypothetical protein
MDQPTWNVNRKGSKSTAVWKHVSRRWQFEVAVVLAVLSGAAAII